MPPIGIYAPILLTSATLLPVEMLALVVSIDCAITAVAPDHHEESGNVGIAMRSAHCADPITPRHARHSPRVSQAPPQRNAQRLRPSRGGYAYSELTRGPVPTAPGSRFRAEVSTAAIRTRRRPSGKVFIASSLDPTSGSIKLSLRPYLFAAHYIGWRIKLARNPISIVDKWKSIVWCGRLFTAVLRICS